MKSNRKLGRGMRSLAIIGFMVTLGGLLLAQQYAEKDPREYFKSGASHYLEGDYYSALKELNAGLRNYPGDKKLKALLDEVIIQQALEEAKKKEEKGEATSPRGINDEPPLNNKGKENGNSDQQKDGDQGESENKGQAEPQEGQGAMPDDGNQGQGSGEGGDDEGGNINNDAILETLANQEMKVRRKKLKSKRKAGLYSPSKDW